MAYKILIDRQGVLLLWDDKDPEKCSLKIEDEEPKEYKNIIEAGVMAYAHLESTFIRSLRKELEKRGRNPFSPLEPLDSSGDG